MGYTEATFNRESQCKEEIRKRFEYENRNSYREIVSEVWKEERAYFLVRRFDKKSGEETFYAGVVFFTIKKDQLKQWTVRYRALTESDGPMDYDFPREYIKKLSSTKNEIALLWRKKCMGLIPDFQDKKNLPGGRSEENEPCLQ